MLTVPMLVTVPGREMTPTGRRRSGNHPTHRAWEQGWGVPPGKVEWGMGGRSNQQLFMGLLLSCFSWNFPSTSLEALRIGLMEPMAPSYIWISNHKYVPWLFIWNLTGYVMFYQQPQLSKSQKTPSEILEYMKVLVTEKIPLVWIF
jgi:hypothetical protein